MRPAFLAIALGLLASSISAAASPRKQQPNIIWIMADDLCWAEVGIYNSTSPHGSISTPHLDAFGRSGMQFTNAYAGYTVCAPSRTTLMTGYHSGHFPAKGLLGTTLPVNQTAPGSSITTVAQILKKAGYATAAVGKCAPLEGPVSQGFDFFIGQVNQAYCHNVSSLFGRGA